MFNHNRAPRTLAVFTGATLALAACTSSGEGKVTTTTQLPAIETWPSRAPQDAAHSAGCDGKISGWRDVTFTKDGEEYQITDIEGGGCAAIYDNETKSHKLLGSVSVGTGIIAPCAVGPETSYVRVFASDIHQSDGKFVGTEFVGDVAATPGAIGPLPDCGATPINGYTVGP